MRKEIGPCDAKTKLPEILRRVESSEHHRETPPLSTATHSGKFKPSVAAAIVIANMIGAGVFTSLGFQLLESQAGFCAVDVVGGGWCLGSLWRPVLCGTRGRSAALWWGVQFSLPDLSPPGGLYFGLGVGHGGVCSAHRPGRPLLRQLFQFGLSLLVSPVACLRTGGSAHRDSLHQPRQ